MQTTLSRNDLYRFERLVSRLVKPSELPGTVTFAPCSEGMMLRAIGENTAITMTVSSAEPFETFTLPWSIVKEFASKKQEHLTVLMEGDCATLHWSVNSIPQQKSFATPKISDKQLPGIPEETNTHPTALFDAFVHAGRCTDHESTRYSLGAICLRSEKSQIITTDGRQALIQDGFTFPWEKDVLCPISRIFASKEIRDCGDSVKLGATDKYVCFQIGTVKFWLKQTEGRFPKLDLFTEEKAGLTWLSIDPKDAEFVANRLLHLPGSLNSNHSTTVKKSHSEHVKPHNVRRLNVGEAYCQPRLGDKPVYLALAEHVTIRGHDVEQKSATELRLSASSYTGHPVAMSMNRELLKNALDFGITQLGLDSVERSPLIGRAENKAFILMPLEHVEPTCDPDKVTVLESKQKAASPIVRSTPPRKIDQPTVRTERPVLATVAREVRPTAEPSQDSTDVIAVSEGLCQTLQDTLTITRRLVRNLKHQRRQNKLMRTTLASLRQLQNV